MHNHRINNHRLTPSAFNLFGVLMCGAMLLAAGTSFASPKHGDHGQNGNPSGGPNGNSFNYVTNVMWLNHFALLPGDPSVQISYNAVNSGVGGGLTALDVQSTTLGEDAEGGGNKVVHMAVQVPPGSEVLGVRVGYELTSSNSFISQIRLAQVQNPPAVALVLLDDPTDLTATGPVYVDSQPTSIQPEAGPLLLSLRVNFGDTSNIIAIRGVALILRSKVHKGDFGD
jgi:hypothetical protein